VYGFEVTGHHQVSVILILTSEIHSIGVYEENVLLGHIFVQLVHQSVEYSTLMGDGHDVFATVQVIAHGKLPQTAWVKFVQLSDNQDGKDISFLIVYGFEVTGHHQVSVILICTLVVHSGGVNENVLLDQLLLHAHQFIE
jgi:hypothetical protein